jgi:hypothetical protein
MYNYHDSRACSYNQFGILSRLDGLDVECIGYGFGLAVWSIEPPCEPHCVVYLIELNWVVLAYNYNLVSKC